MKKIIKCLVLSLLVFIPIGSHRVFAETYGGFQVENTAPTPIPAPAPSGGSGVVSSSNLPMTGEQVAVWGVFVGLFIFALVLFFLIIRKRKEQKEVQMDVAS